MLFLCISKMCVTVLDIYAVQYQKKVAESLQFMNSHMENLVAVFVVPKAFAFVSNRPSDTVAVNYRR